MVTSLKISSFLFGQGALHHKNHEKSTHFTLGLRASCIAHQFLLIRLLTYSRSRTKLRQNCETAHICLKGFHTLSPPRGGGGALTPSPSTPYLKAFLSEGFSVHFSQSIFKSVQNLLLLHLPSPPLPLH